MHSSRPVIPGAVMDDGRDAGGGGGGVDTFLYISLLLGLLTALRIAPFAREDTALPASLLRSEDACASLYGASVALIWLAYAPAAAGLARRGGGAPILLVASVATFVVLTAPLAAIYRVRDDASEEPRRVITYVALAGWLLSLCNGAQSAAWAIVFYVTIVFVHALTPASAARWALELVILLGLHYNLARQQPSRTESVWPWRVAVLVLGGPLGAVVLTPLLLVAGHSWGGLVDRPVNHHGAPYFSTRHATRYPVDVVALQGLVRDHAHVRAVGAGHSWSALASPKRGGLLVSTELLRALAFDNATNVLTVGAGATMGTVQTFLHRHNRQLASNWHGAVTIGGAVATAVQHLGVGISELVLSVELVLANGTRLTLEATDPRFAFVFGSVGMFGVAIAVRLETIARAELLWDSVTRPYVDDATLRTRVTDWASDNASMRSSILWILPSLKETTVQIATLGPPLASPAVDRPRIFPHLPKRHYGDVGLVFSIYANALALALALAEPVARSIATNIAEQEMRAFVRDYVASEVATPHLPMDAHDDPDSNVLPTRLASVEVDVSIDEAHLPSCIAALSEFEYPVALHVRFAQATPLPLATSGSGVFHIDLSFSEPLLGILHRDIRRAFDACPEPLRGGNPVSPGHAGKLSLHDVLERRIHRAPAAATLPGQGLGADHTAFRALVASFDPGGKFTPVQ